MMHARVTDDIIFLNYYVLVATFYSIISFHWILFCFLDFCPFPKNFQISNSKKKIIDEFDLKLP